MKIKNKKFDSVQMMRKIRKEINNEIIDMTPNEIINYLKTDEKEFERFIKNKKDKLQYQL